MYGGLRFEMIVILDLRGKGTYRIQFEQKVKWGVITVAAALLYIQVCLWRPQPLKWCSPWTSWPPHLRFYDRSKRSTTVLPAGTASNLRRLTNTPVRDLHCRTDILTGQRVSLYDFSVYIYIYIFLWLLIWIWPWYTFASFKCQDCCLKAIVKNPRTVGTLKRPYVCVCVNTGGEYNTVVCNSGVGWCPEPVLMPVGHECRVQ